MQNLEREEACNRRLEERCRVLEAELEDLRSRLLAAEDSEQQAEARFAAERANLQRLLEDARAQNKSLQGQLDQVDDASGAALRRLQSVVNVADFETGSDDPASAVWQRRHAFLSILSFFFNSSTFSLPSSSSS